MDGDAAAVDTVASAILKPHPCNFVERPWGGMRIRAYKRVFPLPDQPALTGAGLGEAFEIAAYDADEEARAHPSRLRFADGSGLALPALLRRHASRLLGEELADAHGGGFPLLPKTLDVRELLSVQGHPPGHTEAYVIIDADPGATLRVGFNRDVDPAWLESSLTQGRAWQQRLLELVAPRLTPKRLQVLVAPWLAKRSAGKADLPAELGDAFSADARGQAEGLLEKLRSLYWQVLDSMNAIRVEPGMVIHNANPARIAAAAGRPVSAEVHALGNPEGNEILALEIRRPGPTFRAWDNVRFPLRRIDVNAAIRVLNLSRVAPEELIAPLEPVEGRTGLFLSVRDPSFEIEHLRPAAPRGVDVPAQPVHCLHCIAGGVELSGEDGRSLGTLERGESALVPIGVGGYRVSAAEAGAEVVKARPAPGA
jgi:mannose-6-phosphate isomerase class I